jgi:hypothetical protein
MSDDRRILGSLLNALSGECRVCHCHGDECRLEAGEMCCWMDALKTLCSNPKCVAAAHWRRKHEKRDRARAGGKRRVA